MREWCQTVVGAVAIIVAAGVIVMILDIVGVLR